jgi:Mg-chelatase subunit ChlD
MMTNPRGAFVLVTALVLAVAASAPPRAATQLRTPPGLGASPSGFGASPSGDAVLVDSNNSPRGFNIALAVLGGKIESKTSEYDDHTWAAENLIDGLTYIAGGRGCRPVCGWSSKDGTLPQDIVISFYQGRETQIGAVIVDTTTHETIDSPDRIAKDIEVWTSTTSPIDGFVKITTARLQRRSAEQLIKIAPSRAKFVRLRLLSNYAGRGLTQLGEVKIIETAGGSSILADLPKDLALPALGGAVVRSTSSYEHGSLAGLIDSNPGFPGWRSADGPYGPQAYLPQEIVFALRGDQVALLDRIVLNPSAPKGSDPASWPRMISVLVSTETPVDGFQEVGRVALTADPRDQAFPIGRRARFVKLRILENFGGRHTSLGKVKLIEGSAPGYESILLTDSTMAARGPAETSPVDETGVAVETEPNNTPAQANPLELGRRTKGKIEPLGEQDDFKLPIPGTAPSVLTLELLGRPYIRTSLSLLDASGKLLKQFDPGRHPAQQTTFSWLVSPGEHLLQVTEPLVSIVLVWDTSGSMRKESVENLKQAVEAYVDQVRPSERLNLIRFSNDKADRPVEVLLPEFTNDRERLKTAVQGKFYADGGTPLYDAIAKGIELLEGAQGNRAIIVMTDGADTTSRLKHAAFWKLLDEKRTRLYTIGLGTELPAFVPALGASGGRVLSHMAAATGGRFFFARTPEELKGFYQQIADELRATATYYIRPTLSQGTGGLAVAATGERLASVSAPSQIELILDASGSMNERVEGRPKIVTAKEAMSQIIKGLPDDAQVALRVYGHRIQEGRKGACQDSELVFPFGKVDKNQMLSRVAAIKALGTTPIDYSLRQVAKDFGRTPGEKMVILVTDGKEACKGDPAAAVSELLAKGLKVRLNIVGFALADVATKRDMERVAKLTGGRFFDATNAKALTQAIEQSLAVPYDVLDAAGARVGGGLTGQDRAMLSEGVYTVVVRAAGTPITVRNVRVAQGGFTKVVLKKEGQEVGVQVLGP